MNRDALTRTQAIIIVIVVVIAVIATLIYYAGLFGAATTPKPTPDYILIGGTADLTGPNAFVERIFVYGWKWAVDKINKQGGIYVREYNKKIPVKLIYYDDASDMSKAVSNMETLILKDNVLCMIGKMGPLAASATIPLAERYRVPTFGLAYYPDESVIKSKYYWSQPFESYEQHSSVLFSAINELKLETNRKVAILIMEDPLTTKFFDYYKETAKKYGFNIVYMEPFTILTSDYTVMITKMKESDAEVLIFLGIAPDAVTFWRQCKILNYRPKIALIVLGARTYGWVESMGKDGEYVCTLDFWHPTYPFRVAKYHATCKELAESWEKDTGEKWDSSLAEAADSIFIFADAIEMAGFLDREKVNEAMARVEGEYLSGYLKFIDRHLPVPDVLMQWQGGEKRIVWAPRDVPISIETPIAFPLPPWS
ncbi:MAG: ABC transporter substrate-binding protein [Candidatus Bathyarchaeia archaeon]